MSSTTGKSRKAKIGGKVKYMVTIRNWIHQGFLYLDKTEMFYRVIWELIPFTAVLGIFQHYFNISIIVAIIISAFTSHTLNWIFNDNFWTCIMFTFPKITNPGEEKTIIYLSKMQKRLLNTDSVSGCMIYGSMARGEWQIKSDLDLRILREPGVINGFMAYLFIHRERLIALLNAQPLDMYMADHIPFLRKMRKDEFPIFIKNNDPRLFDEYGTQTITDFLNLKALNKINDESI